MEENQANLQKPGRDGYGSEYEADRGMEIWSLGRSGTRIVLILRSPLRDHKDYQELLDYGGGHVTSESLLAYPSPVRLIIRVLRGFWRQHVDLWQRNIDFPIDFRRISRHKISLLVLKGKLYYPVGIQNAWSPRVVAKLFYYSTSAGLPWDIFTRVWIRLQELVNTKFLPPCSRVESKWYGFNILEWRYLQRCMCGNPRGCD